MQLKNPAEKSQANEVASSGESQASDTKAKAEPVKGTAPAVPVQAAAPVMAATPPPPRPKPKMKVARSNPLESLGPLMKPPVLGGIAGVIVLAAIFYFVPLGGLFAPGGDAELAKFQEVYKEFQSLQQKKASDAEWSSLKNKVTSEIEPILKDLDSSASSDSPHLQHLLWAGRDYLKPMLDNARTESSRDQEKFERHLKEAERIISK